MRICLYSEKVLPRMGGQELVVDALARRFCAAGHQVVVLAPKRRHCDLRDDDHLPYPVVRHPRFYSTRRFVQWYAWWLAKVHHRFGFDVLHCHSVYPTGYIAACCSSIAAVPVVISSHGGDVDDVSPLRRKHNLLWRYHLALDRASALIALSSFTEQRFLELCPHPPRIERIHNGVDLDRFATAVPRPAGLDPIIRSGKFMLFIGRVVRRKGVDLLLDAFRMVADGSDVGLVIAGEGSELEAMEGRAATLGLNGRVRFLGRVEGDTKTWLLRHALCNVMPSRISEMFPLTLLESYAAGRPVIGTQIPGLRTLIEPGRTGILVPSDSPSELADALNDAIRRPGLLDRFGREARRRAEAYDWDGVARRHLALFEDLLGKRVIRKTA